MRDDPSQKIIGVSASGFCLKERLGNLRNVIDQNSDEMRIAMIAMQDEQFAHQTLCLNCVTINTSSRINSGHATGSILRHHTTRFSAR